MPQVESADRKQTSLIVIIITVVILLLAIMGGAFYLLNQKPASKPLTTEEALVVADNTALEGDKDAAIALLQKQLPLAKNDTEKINIHLAIGAAYENKSDLSNALKSYESAHAVKEGFGINSSIARVAEKMGDKAKALEFHKRNHALLKSGQEQGYNNDLERTEKAIKDLGGTP